MMMDRFFSCLQGKATPAGPAGPGL
jgi:hypothetical protein